MRLRGIAVAFIAAGFAIAPVMADEHGLKVETYMDWESASSPQISPDGERIVYTRSYVDQLTDRFSGSLWIMNADGSKNHHLVDGGGAVWSPDGSKIAYVAGAGDDGAEIFVRWMDGSGATTQVTHFEFTPTMLTWSPDGNKIAFRARIPKGTDWTIDMPHPPKGAKWQDNARVIETRHWRQDRVGFTYDVVDHLFVVDAGGGTPKQVTSGDYSVGARWSGLDIGSPFTWSADSEYIIFDGYLTEEDPENAFRSNIYKVHIGSKEITQLTQEEGLWAGPVLSPDGQTIAYGGNQPSTSTYPTPELRMINIDGSNERMIYSGIYSSSGNMVWDEDGDSVLYTGQYHGSQHVFRITMDGEIERLTEGRFMLSLSSVGEDNVAVFNYQSHETSNNIAIMDMDNPDSLRVLTDVNADVLEGVDLGTVEEFWTTAEDGTDVQGWVMYPPDFDAEKEYPLILGIHGGPHGMYGNQFHFLFRTFAAKDYVVVYTNPRGSTGYGPEFAQAIDNAYPGPYDFQDLMAGVDDVVNRGFIDTSRMFVMGCSGGGILTAWVVSNTDRFTAATSMCPVTNWITQATIGDITAWGMNFFDTPWWEDPTLWLDHSPIMLVDQVSTPVLIMVGDQDMRTPVSESEQYYSALRYIGVPTKLIYMRGEYHGTYGQHPSNMLRTHKYIKKWWDEWGPAPSMEE